MTQPAGQVRNPSGWPWRDFLGAEGLDPYVNFYEPLDVASRMAD